MFKLQHILQDVDDPSTYRNIWSLASIITKEQRLISLQWKILHNIYPNNMYLFKINKSTSELCQSCHVMDNIEHFFWECKNIAFIWSKVQNLINTANDTN